MVEPDRPARNVWTPSSVRWSLLVGVALAGLLVGWVFGFTSSTQENSSGGIDGPSSVAVPTSPPSTVTTTPVQSTTAPDTTTGAGLGPLQGRVELLAAVADLGGSVALTVPGPVGDQNLWVIEPGGRMLQRVDAHIRSGSHRYPIMIVGDYVLFTANEGIFRIDLDLDEPARRLAEPGVVIPDVDSDRAWLVGGDLPEWFAPFNGVTGEVGGRTDIIRGFGWPFIGFDNGVLFRPADVAEFGPVVYWPQGGEPETFGLDLTNQSEIQSVVGDRAVVVSPDSRVKVLDVRSGESIAEFTIDFDEAKVIGACLSETADYLAVISSTGFVEVLETATGISRGRISTVDPPWSVGWATQNQLVVVAPPLEGRTFLHVFNIEAGITSPIARLTTPAAWRMATSGAPC